MTTICKTCNEEEDKQLRPGLICEQCMCFVHLSCLSRPGTPGDFNCDVFFDFTCADCSPVKKELVARNKFPWVNVVYLSLHHLSIQSYGISNFGFFHYKTHVGSFIDRNWAVLFGLKCKQKKNWMGTIAGVLSVHNNVLFRSGSTELQESGWWRLQHSFSPAVASHILQEISRDKQPRTRGKSHMYMDKALFLQRAIEMGYKDLIADDEARGLPAAFDSHEPAAKKRRVDSDDLSGVSSTSYYDYYIDSDSRNEIQDDVTHDYASTSLLKDNSDYVSTDLLKDNSDYASTSLLKDNSDYGSTSLLQETTYTDAESSFRRFDYVPMVNIPDASEDSACLPLHLTHYYPDSRSPSHASRPHSPEGEERQATEGNKGEVRRETLFSAELNSVDLPWVEKEEEPADLVEITEYAEIQLLKQVEGLIPRVKEPERRAELRRFRAKLALRRLKRHKHLPVFDLDKAVKVLGGYVTDDAKVVTNVERVLDRFQRSYLMDNLCGTVWQPVAGAILVANVPAEPVLSPHSGVLLKPYIRRDSETVPLYVSLCEELLTKANRRNLEFVLPPRATLDYTYVRPHHIAAVNALCAQHFWPGIDLTEALQYPEHSCVVLHRRLVVACAFLVPHAARGAHYISFVLVRPEWRRASLATFMLYHLLQTCSGTDVTLHVSPTNPAIFMYQKFGFKVEELVQDFYEKYFDIDYKGCRHALLLRLSR